MYEIIVAITLWLQLRDTKTAWEYTTMKNFDWVKTRDKATVDHVK